VHADLGPVELRPLTAAANHAEDTLQTTRKHTAGLEQQKAAAVESLRAQINALNYEWDVNLKN
jgi:hypothetical protein